MHRPDLTGLATEGRLPEAARLDELSTAEQVKLMGDQDRVAVDAVAAVRPQLAAAIDAAVERMRRGGRLIEVGAGTPGRLAVLDAAECGPTFDIKNDQVVAVMAGGSSAIREAAEHGEDDRAAGTADLSALDVQADDVVVGVSASGRTPYVLGAMDAAHRAEALTVAVVNNAGSPIAAAADIAIEALTGPEVISGSTRLKAGTAAKLILNTISSLVMVRLGRTYGDLMVSVRASNDKLRWRAHRIVAAATGASDADVRAALLAADGDAKVATVMLLAGADADGARDRLAAVGGHVRAAAAGHDAPA